ncbi:N-acetylglucosamine kinase-like BadF-type ATPase [Micromonospora sagamiensis]|uniref:N-acetylglucosamine kinase-like BadF-type ATPase n=1 Tax=Micromonospora sagamiensis TaxID=47875 RepID=A0A562WGR0_9ACTN|nr:N-acetylglucosamine kinase-like BadF-type ATPase [Micromonospora sagamiensis]
MGGFEGMPETRPEVGQLRAAHPGGAPVVRIGVDLGQGGCRAVAHHDGRSGQGRTPGFWSGQPAARIADAVGAALADLGPVPDGPVAVGVGMTGLNGQTPPTDDLRTRLRDRGLRGTLHVADDSVTAYLGALGPVPGAVVAAGTGVVVLAAAPDGRTARVDGWGAALGDRGSGHWIGRAALRLALRQRDRDRAGALLDATVATFGLMETLPARWRERPPTPEQLAGFAGTVAELARAGDPDSRSVWRRAGVLLADSAVAALRRAGLAGADVPVAGTGGVFAAADLLLPTFTRALRVGAPHARPVTAAADPLAGALALCAHPTGQTLLAGLVVHCCIEEKAGKR